MVNAVSSSEALARRTLVKSKGSGEEHWCTDYIGRHSAREASDGGEAFLVEMSSREQILPHFHEVDQFQIFVAGSGRMGREVAAPLAVHYADRYTAYGPIVADAQGFSFFTFHATRDPGSVYLHKPGYRERLQPSEQRYRLAPAIVLSTAPVLQSRGEVASESLLSDEGVAAPAAGLLRLGAGMTTCGPDPRDSGGQYFLVVNGDLDWQGMRYPLWSMLFAGAADGALEFGAGANGLEVLVLQFPQRKGAATRS